MNKTEAFVLNRLFSEPAVFHVFIFQEMGMIFFGLRHADGRGTDNYLRFDRQHVRRFTEIRDDAGAFVAWAEKGRQTPREFQQWLEAEAHGT